MFRMDNDHAINATLTGGPASPDRGWVCPPTVGIDFQTCFRAAVCGFVPAEPQVQICRCQALVPPTACSCTPGSTVHHSRTSPDGMQAIVNAERTPAVRQNSTYCLFVLEAWVHKGTSGENLPPLPGAVIKSQSGL
ncbi:hypothetical protein CB1_000591006 [Camelus ferus]|nr:hypothetical protein CB1_000591006 [Camelus ferus]